MTSPVRVEATTDDGLVLEGLVWTPATAPRGTVVFLHGMAGGPLENPWLPGLASLVAEAGWSFVAASNRGTAVLRWANEVAASTPPRWTGAATELVGEAPLDAAAWAGLSDGPVVLCGYSLGATKAVLCAADPSLLDRVCGVVLLACTDMVAYTRGQPWFAGMLAEARELAARGKAHRLLESSWASMPMSAATLLERCARGTPADVIDASSPTARTALSELTVPCLAVVADGDPAVGEDTAAGLAALTAQQPRLRGVVLSGGDHGFTGVVEQMYGHVAGFLDTLGG